MIFGLFWSPMQFDARGEHMAQSDFFPLYNSHVLYRMRGIISCYGIYNASQVYSSLPQGRQYLSASKALSL